jgi:acetolactate synthase-1/2/3 large subunit
VPTLFVAGAAPLREAETLPLQGGLDQVAMAAPITKWSHRVTHTERIPDLTAQALRIASSGRPGPVFLEIPIDVLFSRVEEGSAPLPSRTLPGTAPAPPAETIDQLITLLAGAERPAILVGGGAWFSGSEAELRLFAERTGTPVFSNGKAHGLLPASHPLCGRGFTSLAIAAGLGAPADLVLVLGARLGLFTGGRGARLIPAAAKLVQVDIAAEEIGRNREVDLAIVADCRETLRALNGAAAGRAWPDREAWHQTVQAVAAGHRTAFSAALQQEKPPIHPYRLAAEVAKALPDDAIVTADGGETSSWMDMVADVHSGGHWLSHGYLGCLGTGMPFAIAAQVAHPGKRVLCIIGDVVNNDQIWGMSAHGQDLIYGEGRRVVTELGATRYDLAAAGFGCHAEHVTDPRDLPAALERAFASGKPACVNVMSDPSVIAPVTVAMVGGARSETSAEAEGGDASIAIPYYEDLEE